MKLNPDCIRDLMLFCEENTYIRASKVGNSFVASYQALRISSLSIQPELSKYDAGELIYHIIQLSESGYLATDFHFDPKANFAHGELPRIYYVTPKGHEFIASVKGRSAWEVTSKILKSFGAVSLTAIETISKGIAAAVIEQSLSQSG